MKVLFIGGTGTISSACSRLAVNHGMELYLLNRGKTTERQPPEGVKVIYCDWRDPQVAYKTLKPYQFDVVVDWICFTPEQAQIDISLFQGKTSQFVFISSASAYKKPVTQLPITESTLLHNPYWEYSRLKILCEQQFINAFKQDAFPITIVRPSHTYDKTRLPFAGRYAVIDRMRKGNKILIHGDGTSLWVLTHHADFAKGFLGLLGNPHTIGEAYHITSDELLTWNQIHLILANAAGVSEIDAVYLPSSQIAQYDKDWGDGLLGDKSHSVVFDNTKIKRTVPGYSAVIPYSQGASEIISWFDEDPSRKIPDQKYNSLVDQMILDNKNISVQLS